ncbi:MAG TPA: preprotein translocase subunit SecG [Burkholderiaceae bacterium]|jgi:preprotein translocase subunit SecG
MNLVWNLVVALQILAALVMIGLVLIQHGKGADMGASFGSGASGSLFGATGSANFMSRSTAVCAAIFFACTLALAYSATDRLRPASSGSVFDGQPAPSAPAASGPLKGAALLPGTASGAVAAASSAAAPAASAAPAATASGAGAVPTK